MKKWILPILALTVASAFSVPRFARAEDDSLAKEEAASEKTKDRPEWKDALVKQYHLTDEQIKSMQDRGLSFPQMAMVSSLAEKSGKTIDQVLKMRTEDKMGWGKIAKELGIPPQEIGRSVASVRHEINEERHASRLEKKEDQREARMNHREQMREAHDHGRNH